MFLRQRPWSLDRRIYRQRDYTGRSPGIKYVSCWKATEEAQGCTQRIYCYCALMWETFLFHCRGEQWVIVSSTFFIITGFYFINESDDVKGTHYIFNSCFFFFFFLTEQDDCQHLPKSQHIPKTIWTLQGNINTHTHTHTPVCSLVRLRRYNYLGQKWQSLHMTELIASGFTMDVNSREFLCLLCTASTHFLLCSCNNYYSH